MQASIIERLPSYCVSHISHVPCFKAGFLILRIPGSFSDCFHMRGYGRRQRWKWVLKAAVHSHTGLTCLHRIVLCCASFCALQRMLSCGSNHCQSPLRCCCNKCCTLSCVTAFWRSVLCPKEFHCRSWTPCCHAFLAAPRFLW